MTTQEEVKKVVSAAAIKDVYLRSFSAECFVPRLAVIPSEITLEFGTETDFAFAKEEGMIVSFVDFKVLGKKKVESPETKIETAEKPENVFHIGCVFTVIYALSDKNLDEKAVEFFAKQNAYFNVYPFIREYVLNASTRLGIEPIKIPLLKSAVKTES